MEITFAQVTGPEVIIVLGLLILGWLFVLGTIWLAVKLALRSPRRP